MPHKTKGFTLIEVLVVIVIIGIVVTAGTFGFQSVRQNARDTSRRALIASIESALSRYLADCSKYPSSTEWNNWLTSGSAVTGDNSSNSCKNNNQYLEEIPRDPQYPVRNISYRAINVSGINREYVLCASLETAPSPSMDTSACSSCGSFSCNFIVNSN